jgi:phenylalanyl-tRNA synthetase beta chain
MKVTYNWLKDFVEIKVSPQALAEKLTMAGLEVTALEEKAGDFVFEIEVTANRPDCLSVIGIAREVAAITGKKLILGTRSIQNRGSSIQNRNLEIKVENKKDCPLYTARIIKDVKVGTSPDWLKKRLELVGCRSVNNIVDTTNYILFTWGEPLHAFDLDKLKDPPNVIIRRASKKEEITTIDGIRRALDENILVIADEDKPVAIAGVMGGKETEVTELTKNILLEAAIFNPIVIRRQRQALGLQSESAYRFERGIDPDIVERSSAEATKIISQIAQGSFVLTKSSGLPKKNKKTINLGLSQINNTLGITINPAKVKGILSNLGFKVQAKRKNIFTVGIPSFRQDVNLTADLLEEVARIFGYTQIPPSTPAVKPQVAVYSIRETVSLIKNILNNLGLNEVITYSLMDKGTAADSQGKDSAPIEILNPLSKDQEILRPSLAPSLLRCIAYNLNQKQEYVNIFEIAKVFSSANQGPKEELSLGIALSGVKSWFVFQEGMIKDSVTLLHLKGILEVVFARLGIANYSFSREDENKFSVKIGQDKIGLLLQAEKHILERFDIKNKNVVIAELFLERLWLHRELTKKFSGLPKYPAVYRDISLVVKEEIPTEDILEAIKEKAHPLLKEAKVIDYYKGKQIPAGSKGLTISCLYRSDERTLTEAEITSPHQDIALFLTKEFNAQIRARE